MKNFNEWLKEKNIEEGSLGLQRRQRVAAGLAKRAAITKQLYPNPSDSAGHDVLDQLHRDAQSAAGRFDRADQRMGQRSNARIAKMALNDKTARQMRAGRGNPEQIKANVQASRDANAAVDHYNNPEVLSQRGKDPIGLL